MSLARIIALTGVGLTLLTNSAFAHAHLKSSTPAANAKVSIIPSELDLTFSEGVNLKFTGVKMTGPDKKGVPTGAASLGAGGDTTLVVPISAQLPTGVYEVDWHALATDGHKTSGSYSFTVLP